MVFFIKVESSTRPASSRQEPSQCAMRLVQVKADGLVQVIRPAGHAKARPYMLNRDICNLCDFFSRSLMGLLAKSALKKWEFGCYSIW